MKNKTIKENKNRDQNNIWYGDLYKDIIIKANKPIENYILNEENKLISVQFIKNLLLNYDIAYEIYDKKIFEIAMTHESYTEQDWSSIKIFKTIFSGINFINGEELSPIKFDKIDQTLPIQKYSYERLELLGDAVLRLVMTDYLLCRYEELESGALTKLRARLENASALADLSKKFQLNQYILLSRNNEFTNAREKNEKIISDVFESFIGALYLDSNQISYDDLGQNPSLMQITRTKGYELTYKFIKKLIEEEFLLGEILSIETNYKDLLLQAYHKFAWGDPIYCTKQMHQDQNQIGRKLFEMYVRDPFGKIIGRGFGSSKQKGEKIAAKKAIEYLKLNPPPISKIDFFKE